MQSSKYIDDIIKIINEHIAEPLSNHDANCPLEEKGLDSIGFIEIIIDLGSEFSFSWPIEKLSTQDIKTANDFISVVVSQSNEAADESQG